MASARTISDDIFAWVLSARSAVLPLTAVYLLLGAYFLITDYALHDEGLVTYLYANWGRHELLPVLFFQKAKPVLTLLYLPASFLGIRATLAAHLLFSSLAIPLLVSVARKLGLAFPNVPALVLTFSPIFLLGGASGLNNIDGIVGTTLFLYLLVVRRSLLWAGLVLGMLPWMRHELALFSALFALRALFVDRSRALIAGALGFPLFYWIGGSVYHADILWLIHYPPATVSPMPGNPVWAWVTPGTVVESLLSITPLVGLAFVARVRQLSSVERALVVYALIWLTLSTLLPVWRIANFGFVPRYSVQVLPMLGLLVARGLERWMKGLRPAPADALVPLILLGTSIVAIVGSSGNVPGVVPALLMTGAVLVLAALRKARVASALAVALVFAGPLLGLREQVGKDKLATYLPEMTEWIRNSRQDGGVEGPVSIYTNSPLLAAHLEGAGNVPGVDVRFMVGVDQQYDFLHLANGANGQRQALQRLAGIWFYGRGELPGAYTPESLRDGTLFAVRNDRRLDFLLLPDVWEGHLTTVVEGDGFRVMKVTPGRTPADEAAGAEAGPTG